MLKFMLLIYYLGSQCLCYKDDLCYINVYFYSGDFIQFPTSTHSLCLSPQKCLFFSKSLNLISTNYML